MAKYTSRVFAVWPALYDLLVAQAWSAHPRTGRAPAVFFGDMVEPLDEAIIVVGSPASDSPPEFVTYGSSVSMDQEFTLRIMIGSKVPGCDGVTALARLAELCDLVQTALRSSTTGRPAGGFSQTVPGVLWWKASLPNPQIYALPDGFGAYAEIDLLFHCHI